MGGNRQQRTRKVFLEGLEDRSLMAVDLTAGLMGHWRFDEAVGTTAADVMNQNPGELKNGAVPSLGQVENGLQLDGVNDYVALGAAATLPTTGTISISAWIQPTATTGLRNIVSHGYATNPNGEVFLRINNGKYEVGSWNGTTYTASATIPAGDVNSWVQLVGQFDGSAWKLYRNGTALATTTTTVGAVPVSGNWAIGARGTGTERFFAGKVDEVRIFNRALNAEEITALSVEIGHSPVARNPTILIPELVADGHLVGVVPVEDADSGATHTFSIESGNELGLFAVNSIGQIALLDSVGLALAGDAIHTLSIRIADVGADFRSTISHVTIGRAWMLFVGYDSLYIGQNEDYILNLNNGGLPGLSWVVNWGDGIEESYPPETVGVGHSYQSEGTFYVSATVSDGIATAQVSNRAVAEVKQIPGVPLIRNGSFEMEKLSGEGAIANPKLWDLLPNAKGQTLRDWTVIKRDDISATIPVADQADKVEIHAWGLFPNFFPRSGAQYVELDGDQNGPGGSFIDNEKGFTTIAQTVTTKPGASYDVSFWVGGRPGTTANQNVVTVTLRDATNNTVIQTFTSRQVSAGGWAQERITFTATGSATSVQFSPSLSAPNDTLGAFLDDVSISLAASGQDLVTARRSQGAVTVAGAALTGLEEKFFPVKADEHFEVGGTFEFKVQGNLSASSNVKWELLQGTTRVNSGAGAVTYTDVPTQTGITFANTGIDWVVRFFNDTNNNQRWDTATEEATASSPFISLGVQTKTIDFLIDPKYFAPNANAKWPNNEAANAFIMTSLSDSTRNVLRKDSADDWRAAVRFEIGRVDLATATFDSVKVVDAEQRYKDAGEANYEFYYIGELLLGGGGTRKVKAATDNADNHRLTTLIDPFEERNMTLMHEILHQVKSDFPHSDDPNDLLFQPASLDQGNFARNELSKAHADALENWQVR